MNPLHPNLGELIIELIDICDVSDADSVKHCFDDLAEANKAQSSQILSQSAVEFHPSLATDFSGAISAKKITGI
jgi:hypothetical protein